MGLTLDFPPGLSKYFSLVPMPGHVSIALVVGAVLDYTLARGWELMLQRAFPASKPPCKGYLKLIPKEERMLIEQEVQQRRKDD